ncbi:MAG: M23 family metallopeptidase, partial [Bacteroidota bacterium]
AHLNQRVPLREELLDHLCCDIEALLQQDVLFSQAIEQVFSRYSKETLQKIEQQSILSQQNNNNMITKFSLAAVLTTVFTITAFFGVHYDPPSGSPIGGDLHVTSHFGWRMHPVHKEKKMHKGIDLRAPIGTPVLATSGGVVLEVQRANKGYGNMVTLQHDDTYITRYSQLSEIKVTKGQTIDKGQVIALSGNSGASTGPHLHYEVLKDGQHVDPKLYMP